MNINNNEFIKYYNAGHRLCVTFKKMNDEFRMMIVQRDPIMESHIKGVHDFKDKSIKRVIEILPNGEKQWRAIVLDRIISVMEM